MSLYAEKYDEEFEVGVRVSLPAPRRSLLSGPLRSPADPRQPFLANFVEITWHLLTTTPLAVRYDGVRRLRMKRVLKRRRCLRPFPFPRLRLTSFTLFGTFHRSLSATL
jgi:hypothetical protein